MANILILFDQEGCIGISPDNSSFTNNSCYIIQCVKTIDAINTWKDNATIYICDLHCNGNILTNNLSHYSPNVIFYKMPWSIDFSIKYDYCLLLGFHGHSRTEDPLGHSFRPEIKSVKMNQKDVGEASVFRKFIESYGVNVNFISGNKFIASEEIVDEKPHFYINNSEYANILYTDYIKKLLSVLCNHSVHNRAVMNTHTNDTLSVTFHKSDFISYMMNTTNDESTVLLYSSTKMFIHSFPKVAASLNMYNTEFNKYLEQIRSLPTAYITKNCSNPLLISFFKSPETATLSDIKAIYTLLTKKRSIS